MRYTTSLEVPCSLLSAEDSNRNHWLQVVLEDDETPDGRRILTAASIQLLRYDKSRDTGKVVRRKEVLRKLSPCTREAITVAAEDQLREAHEEEMAMSKKCRHEGTWD